MIRKKVVLIFLVAMSSLQSQTFFVDGFGIDGPPTDLFVVDNYLYAGAYGGGFLARFDLYQSSPLPEIVSTNYNPNGGPFSLAFHPEENTMYMGSLTPPFLSKLDLSNSLPANSEFLNVSPVSAFYGICINNTLLYCAQSSSGDLFSMDLDIGVSSYQLFFSDPEFNILEPKIHNDEIYYATTNTNGDYNIYKINLINPSSSRILVASDIGSYVTSTHITGNYLYVGTDQGEIIKYDLTLTLPLIKETLYSSLGGQVLGISNRENRLYASIDNTNEIITFIDSTLSVNESIYDTLQLYPNPVSNVLYIENHSMKNNLYRLYDLNGSLLIEDNNIKRLDMGSLATGMYFLNIERDGIVQVKKIVKQ